MSPLDRIETRKDTLQVAIDSGAQHAGQIMGIVVGAVRDVTRELGDWATDVLEMREAAKRAEADDADRPGPRLTGALREATRARSSKQ
jgi:hypothetical protein